MTTDQPREGRAEVTQELLGYHNMGSHGRCDWTHLREAVAEATVGSRAHSTPFNPDFYPGHHTVEGINFNSLDRIVTAFVDAALSRPQQEASGEVREALSEVLDLVDGLYRTYGLELNGVDATTARRCRNIALSAQPLADARDVEREESLDEIAQNIGYGSALEALGDLATRKFASSTAPDELRAALAKIRDLPPGKDCCNQAAVIAAEALARPDRMAEMEGEIERARELLIDELYRDYKKKGREYWRKLVAIGCHVESGQAIRAIAAALSGSDDNNFNTKEGK